MTLHLALAAIEAAQSQREVLEVVKAFARKPLAGCDGWLVRDIEDASDVEQVALELARLRVSTMSTEASLVEAEAVFAQACVKNAALADPSASLAAFRARAPRPERRARNR